MLTSSIKYNVVPKYRQLLPTLEGLEPNLNKEQKKVLEKLKDIKFQHEELLKLTTKIE